MTEGEEPSPTTNAGKKLKREDGSPAQDNSKKLKRDDNNEEKQAEQKVSQDRHDVTARKLVLQVSTEDNICKNNSDISTLYVGMGTSHTSRWDCHSLSLRQP